MRRNKDPSSTRKHQHVFVVGKGGLKIGSLYVNRRKTPHDGKCGKHPAGLEKDIVNPRLGKRPPPTWHKDSSNPKIIEGTTTPVQR